MVVLAMRWEGSNDIYLIGQEIEKKEKKKKRATSPSTVLSYNIYMVFCGFKVLTPLYTGLF